MTSDQLRARAAVHRTIHGNRLLSLGTPLTPDAPLVAAVKPTEKPKRPLTPEQAAKKAERERIRAEKAAAREAAKEAREQSKIAAAKAAAHAKSVAYRAAMSAKAKKGRLEIAPTPGTRASARVATPHARPTFQLDGTSEGAEKGWETRRAGQAKRHAKDAEEKAYVKGMQETDPDKQREAFAEYRKLEYKRYKQEKRDTHRSIKRSWKATYDPKPPGNKKMAASNEEQGMHRDVHMLRERAAVHRTIHANRMMLANPRDEGYLFEAAEMPVADENDEKKVVVISEEEKNAPAEAVPGEVVLPEADAVIPARPVKKKKAVGVKTDEDEDEPDETDETDEEADEDAPKENPFAKFKKKAGEA